VVIGKNVQHKDLWAGEPAYKRKTPPHRWRFAFLLYFYGSELGGVIWQGCFACVVVVPGLGTAAF
jgi:hypothetical protein